MLLITPRFDVTEHLRTEEEMQVYIETALEEAVDDTFFIARALGDVARACEMSRPRNQNSAFLC